MPTAGESPLSCPVTFAVVVVVTVELVVPWLWPDVEVELESTHQCLW